MKTILTVVLTLFLSIPVAYAEDLGKDIESIVIENPSLEGLPFEYTRAVAVCLMRGYQTAEVLDFHTTDRVGEMWGEDRRMVGTSLISIRKTQLIRDTTYLVSKVRCFRPKK